MSISTAFTIMAYAMLAWLGYNIAILVLGSMRRRRRSRDPERVLPEPGVSFSVIVPAKNEARVIGRLLGYLADLEYPRERFEVILVEDGSTDGTDGICGEYAAHHPLIMKYIHGEDYGGKPAALNAALRHAKGDVVAVLDADTVPSPDLLPKAAKYFRDPGVAAVQGRTLSVNPETNLLTRIVSSEEQVVWWNLVAARQSLGLFIPLLGSCQFIRRRVLEEVGGWDELSLTEDVELAGRLTAQGRTIRFASDVTSFQETPSRLTTLFRQRTRWSRGYMETFLKYGFLLRKPCLKKVDGEIVLASPYMALLGMLMLLITGLSRLVGADTLTALPYPVGYLLAAAGTLSPFMYIMLATPRRAASLPLIPLMYGYWILQGVVALYSLLQMALGRPRVWTRTVKEGLCSPQLIGFGHGD